MVTDVRMPLGTDMVTALRERRPGLGCCSFPATATRPFRTSGIYKPFARADFSPRLRISWGNLSCEAEMAATLSGPNERILPLPWFFPTMSTQLTERRRVGRPRNGDTKPVEMCRLDVHFNDRYRILGSGIAPA